MLQMPYDGFEPVSTIRSTTHMATRCQGEISCLTHGNTPLMLIGIQSVCGVLARLKIFQDGLKMSFIQAIAGRLNYSRSTSGDVLNHILKPGMKWCFGRCTRWRLREIRLVS